jgi:hypothetical protein
MGRFTMIVRSLPLFTLTMVGCASGGSAPATKASTVPAPAVSADDSRVALRSTCVAMFERARTCTDEYLAMLVDVRVRNDHPPGIAALDQEIGRPALEAKAHEEWAEDSKDAVIAQVCDQVVQMDDGRLEPTRQVVESCLAEAACGGFVDCLEPITESMMTERR